MTFSWPPSLVILSLLFCALVSRDVLISVRGGDSSCFGLEVGRIGRFVGKCLDPGTTVRLTFAIISMLAPFVRWILVHYHSFAVFVLQRSPKALLSMIVSPNLPFCLYSLTSGQNAQPRVFFVPASLGPKA